MCMRPSAANGVFMRHRGERNTPYASTRFAWPSCDLISRKRLRRLRTNRTPKRFGPSATTQGNLSCGIADAHVPPSTEYLLQNKLPQNRKKTSTPASTWNSELGVSAPGKKHAPIIAAAGVLLARQSQTRGFASHTQSPKTHVNPPGTIKLVYYILS